jgi:hypothetical protein
MVSKDSSQGADPKNVNLPLWQNAPKKGPEFLVFLK